jgi:hypothetical protein
MLDAKNGIRLKVEGLGWKADGSGYGKRFSAGGGSAQPVAAERPVKSKKKQMNVEHRISYSVIL